MTPSTRDGRARSRGQSETLGFIILFSILIVGALLVVGLGSVALDDTEQSLSDDRAEQSLTQFASKAGLVALGESDSQRISFPTGAGEQFSVEENTGWLKVTVENQTAASSRYTVMNQTLGSVVYRHGNSRAAYQGGGVWRANDAGGAMVSPPEFHFRNGTLTLPTISVRGSGSLGSNVVVTKTGVNRTFPVIGTVDEDEQNPLNNHLVRVTVKSEFYQGWGQYFEERTDGEVKYNHSNQEATLVLVTPIEETEVTSATASLAAAGDFTLAGRAGSRCGGSSSSDFYTDSYDSTELADGEDYCDYLSNNEPGIDGDIIYGGDVDISQGTGGADICGNIISGGTVTTKGSTDGDEINCGGGKGGGQPTVYGNIEYTDDCIDCEDAIASIPSRDWEATQIDGVRSAAPIGFYVESQIEAIEEDADEVDPGTDQTLQSGDYYFDSSLTVDNGDNLTLDTSDGRIDIAVEENVIVEDDSTIHVTGDGRVRVFVGGNVPDGTYHFALKDSSEINETGTDARKFRMYGKEDFKATIGNSGGIGTLAKFVGVIYAPPSETSDSSVNIDGAEVFGGMLTGTTTLNAGSIHYDEALRNEQVIEPDAGAVTVTFLHVTVNEITVKSG
ncbi:hypothetical protein GRX03_11455 [Halovenus sp. WSH3]|uniref:DUF7305 domain-containing protein n=1 Tax=Halovenus carboxidivorans TaxID=2692199 RepID=A0A6B0T2L2_9EURY|nr:hypothetical protein [Halovenus carboxidivorans]MXR52215.1 hypothetical protein [Halovenus carboxidivorans]